MANNLAWGIFEDQSELVIRQASLRATTKPLSCKFIGAQATVVSQHNSLLCCRYHYNVSAHRLEVHVAKGLSDGLYISSAACSGDLWAVIMDAGNGYTEQQYIITDGCFMPKNWIMEQWDKGLYITSLAGRHRAFMRSRPPSVPVLITTRPEHCTGAHLPIRRGIRSEPGWLSQSTDNLLVIVSAFGKKLRADL